MLAVKRVPLTYIYVLRSPLFISSKTRSWIENERCAHVQHLPLEVARARELLEPTTHGYNTVSFMLIMLLYTKWRNVLIQYLDWQFYILHYHSSHTYLQRQKAMSSPRSYGMLLYISLKANMHSFLLQIFDLQARLTSSRNPAHMGRVSQWTRAE